MVHFVGAGPGAANLITIRGKSYIEAADVIIYAGSLVNPRLLEWAGRDCEIYDSSRMTLEEVISVMERAEGRQKTTVRLHTGDPSIYGAVREQMDLLDERGIAYDSCPGVSSLCGAAAALDLEYTLPGISQSLIVTRMAGRTGVPERESIEAFAGHQAVMAIFLSAGRTEELSRRLMEGGYPPDTPAAIVCRATWEDERKAVGTVAELPKMARENQITRTALILVGKAVAQSGYQRSRLYHPEFATGFRQASGRSGFPAGAEPESGIQGQIAGEAAPPIGAGPEDGLQGQIAGEAAPPTGAGPEDGLQGQSAGEAAPPTGAGPEDGLQGQNADKPGFHKLYLISFTSAGAALGRRVAESLAPDCETVRFTGRRGALPWEGAKAANLRGWAAEAFREAEGILFISACGIALRLVAPLVADKWRDPAVLVMDEGGVHCISLLSGHAGGGNDWCRRISQAAGAEAVITTATDVRGKFAPDVFAAINGLSWSDRLLSKEIAARILEGEVIPMYVERGIYAEEIERDLEGRFGKLGERQNIQHGNLWEEFLSQGIQVILTEPVENSYQPLAKPVKSSSELLAVPTAEDGKPLPVPVTDSSESLAVPTAEDGKPLPVSVTDSSESLAAPAAEDGKPLPVPVTDSSELLAAPTADDSHFLAESPAEKSGAAYPCSRKSRQRCGIYIGVHPSGFFNSWRQGRCSEQDSDSGEAPKLLHLLPKIYTIGIGCKRGTDAGKIQALADRVLRERGIPLGAVAAAGSIDLKKDEPGLAEFCTKNGLPFFTFSAAKLEGVPGKFAGSPFVKKVAGVDNVCERSAVLAAGRIGENPRLCVEKTCGEGVTLAVATYRLCRMIPKPNTPPQAAGHQI